MRKCLTCGASIEHKVPQARHCSILCRNRKNHDKEKHKIRERIRRARIKASRIYGQTIREQAKMAGFRSGFERTLATSLKQRKVAYTYESVKIPYTLSGNYNPDFILSNGIIVEAKGVLSAEDRRKMVAVKAQHPDLDIRFVFMGAHNRVPHLKSTHAAWADRHGFPWADKEIPDDWINE